MGIPLKNKSKTKSKQFYNAKIYVLPTQIKLFFKTLDMFFSAMVFCKKHLRKKYCKNEVVSDELEYGDIGPLF